MIHLPLSIRFHPQRPGVNLRTLTTPLRKTASFTLALKGPVILRAGFIFCEGNTCLTLIISCEPPPNDLMDSQDSRYQSGAKEVWWVPFHRPHGFPFAQVTKEKFCSNSLPTILATEKTQKKQEFHHPKTATMNQKATTFEKACEIKRRTGTFRSSFFLPFLGEKGEHLNFKVTTYRPRDTLKVSTIPGIVYNPNDMFLHGDPDLDTFWPGAMYPSLGPPSGLLHPTFFWGSGIKTTKNLAKEMTTRPPWDPSMGRKVRIFTYVNGWFLWFFHVGIWMFPKIVVPPNHQS